MVTFKYCSGLLRMEQTVSSDIVALIIQTEKA